MKQALFRSIVMTEYWAGIPADRKPQDVAREDARFIGEMFRQELGSDPSIKKVVIKVEPANEEEAGR